ncbi:hypothetical protein L6164_008366 [Bauhinia variegata]|uniref:Uncharacterized protein n=1 Tax=Bauhinia variegata TaxID=167791 RepID=A0ACB9PGI3_BAUVA|nr:hypothetical protein L6164_008366 [Bauhinia variegata]
MSIPLLAKLVVVGRILLLQHHRKCLYLLGPDPLPKSRSVDVVITILDVNLQYQESVTSLLLKGMVLDLLPRWRKVAALIRYPIHLKLQQKVYDGQIPNWASSREEFGKYFNFKNLVTNEPGSIESKAKRSLEHCESPRFHGFSAEVVVEEFMQFWLHHCSC